MHKWSIPQVFALAVIVMAAWTVVAQSATPAPGGPGLTAEEIQLVQVDWFEEMLEGGTTMIALGVVSVALLAFIIERAVRLRTASVVPRGLLDELLPLFGQKQYDRIRELCARRPSAISDIALFLVDHREADPQLLLASAGDVGARAIERQERMCQPFAVIAGIAPLLGLLGTMIGMIESFKLVEVFGDEGGASLLAGSISKALITTAVGLILAIPALVAYHGFKYRAQAIGTELEIATERLFNVWFLAPQAQQQSHAAARPVQVRPQPKLRSATPVGTAATSVHAQPQEG